jgi:putative spermidine/putrescine transport system ATP-binding protein
MTMSDLVVVMGPDNRVHQMGSPLEIYRHPADTFVADFIGTSNLLEGSLRSLSKIRIGDTSIAVASTPAGISPGSRVTVSVRPEDISIVPGRQSGDNRLSGTVAFVRDVGSSVEIYLDCNGLQIVSQSTPKGRPEVKQGSTATAVLPPEACVVLKS